jgi:flavin-dependent dehydrogenase
LTSLEISEPNRRLKVDVAVVGGGPSGSTLGSILKKYRPDLKVAIFERERFPRDHVGESLIPAVTTILAEMGVWDKVEAANFPIKLGATYRWGATDDLWKLDFLAHTDFTETERPGKFESQRAKTSFQVDRSIYDKILLDHAKELGCEVYMETCITQVKSVAGFITGLVARNSSDDTFEVKAKHYIDATGESGLLRKALGVGVESPTSLRNIAFWDYWTHAEWPERYSGTATRIQVLSLGWGWIWFIPITQTRTSVGLVLPAEYYKKSGQRPLELYLEALQTEPRVADLLAHASREDQFATTKDWNFLASDLAGQNWFLIGDSCGFADPILSAGLTLAQTSARKVAYCILELRRGRLSPEWIRRQYVESHRGQILHHMRFAEFWYAGNGCFTDLKEFCTTLANEVGLNLTPDEAFAWLGGGGFALDRPGFAGALGFPLTGLQVIAKHLTGGAVKSAIRGCNCVQANLEGVSRSPYAIYEDGAIIQADSFNRSGAILPRIAIFELMLRAAIKPIYTDAWLTACHRQGSPKGAEMSDFNHYLEVAEALVQEGWIQPSYNPAMPPSAIYGQKLPSNAT